MGIFGTHVIIYTTNADADRTFFKDVLEYESEDAGDGWLIFGLPPAELAFHPNDRNDVHQVSFMVDDIQAFVADMRDRGMMCSDPSDQGWGIMARLTLPGGGVLGVYQPRHSSPILTAAAKKPKKKAAKPAKKAKPAPKKKKVTQKKKTSKAPKKKMARKKRK